MPKKKLDTSYAFINAEQPVDMRCLAGYCEQGGSCVSYEAIHYPTHALSNIQSSSHLFLAQHLAPTLWSAHLVILTSAKSTTPPQTLSPSSPASHNNAKSAQSHQIRLLPLREAAAIITSLYNAIKRAVFHQVNSIGSHSPRSHQSVCIRFSLE